MTSTRQEEDAFGSIAVEARRLWGAQTQRSLEHFAISTERLPPELILALASVKLACAQVNEDLGLLPPDKARAIRTAAQEVLDGRHADEFPLSVWQTGSGTQSHMNLNEVLANRGSELLGGPRGRERLLHPNDEVNLGQSSNDVFPSAIHLAAALALHARLLPALDSLQATLAEKALAFTDIVKIGRTHLQDATPITLGQEFSGYAAQLAQARQRLADAMQWLYPLAIGGTAVGTGLNTHAEFGQRVAAALASRHGLPFSSAGNKFAALAAHDGLVAVHGALKTLAVALMKIANDIRWLASGPRAGLGELHLPENEPGSSIMPGKVNPTQCEALTMLCAQVMGNDVALGIGAASGHFELNVFQPLIAHNLLQSIRLLGDSMASFDLYCARGILPNRERIAEHLGRSLMLVTALVPHIGHDKAVQIAKQAHQNACSLRQAALTLGYATADELDLWLRPESMLGPR
ncbi:MAG: Fumarate hydratase (fumarase C),aerobic Class [Pseudomonadota bacterium]